MIHAHRSFLFVLLILLSACQQLGIKPAETFVEQVAYVEAGAQGAIKTLTDLTCIKYTATGQCTDPARVLHPARSKVYLEQIANARTAAKAAGSMPQTGGTCLGQASNPTACLGLANTLLKEVQTILNAAQKGGA